MGKVTYDILVTPKAWNAISESALWWAKHRDADQADRWLKGVYAAMDSLSTKADRQPLAYESNRFPFEMRQLNYGLGKRPTHRILFRIAGSTVSILTVRHLAQAEVTPDDIK